MRNATEVCDDLGDAYRAAGRFRWLAATALTIAVALLPWSRIPAFPFDLRHAQWSDVVLGVSVLLWAAASLLARRRPDVGVLSVLACYGAAASLSFAVAAPKNRTTTGKWLGILLLCALALVVADLARDPEVRGRLADAMAANAIVLAVASVVALVLFWSGRHTGLVGTFGDLRPSERIARVQLGAYHPALLASWTIAAFAVVASSVGGVTGWRRTLYRAALVALPFVCLLTISREAIGLGLAAAWWRWGAGEGRVRRNLVILTIASALAVIGPTFVNLDVDPGNPFAVSIKEGESNRKAWGRAVLEAIDEHPLFGVGPGVAPGRFGGSGVDAHNTPVNVAGTLGVLALGAFAAVVVAAWRRRDRGDLALTGAMVALGVTALAIDLEDFRHVWLLLGLALAGAPGRRAANPTVTPGPVRRGSRRSSSGG